MRLHLDTSFLIDWRKADPRVDALRSEIRQGMHAISVDPIVVTEFRAVPVPDRTTEIILAGVLALGDLVPISNDATRLAASWLGTMDERQRRAHFADALIGAVASLERATLVTGDQRLHPRIEVRVLNY